MVLPASEASSGDGVARLLTTRVWELVLSKRVWDLAANDDLILRSPPQAGVSKDAPHKDRPNRLSSIAIAFANRSGGRDHRAAGPILAQSNCERL
jgi:hypothetical protein